MSRITRHLTYGNVIATLALFLALGGTAFAAARIGSADVVNNSLKSIDIKNRTLGVTDLSNATRNSFKPRWALVDADGTIRAQSGGISVDTHTSSGLYYLGFGSSMSGKPITVTPAYTNADAAYRGTVTTGLCGGTGSGQGQPCSANDDTSHIYVGTTDTASTTSEDHAFYIVVG